MSWDIQRENFGGKTILEEIHSLIIEKASLNIAAALFTL